MKILPKVLRVGNKVHGNVYGGGFFFCSAIVWKIDVIGKRLVYCDSCTSVVSNTFAHVETIWKN